MVVVGFPQATQTGVEGGMSEEPERHRGLTFEAWNEAMHHDPHDVVRARAHYLTLWRNGGGTMPPPRRPAPAQYEDRYEEL